ncbi:hypothetical protein [Paraburkholderia caledonica]|uniref:hypothetical protein n=1 Tax=Paraburkholderia caledonica TaxID=134536 RepID=UPI001374D156|nr:hypothetical protein [Paraburkholderia caledonica]
MKHPASKTDLVALNAKISRSIDCMKWSIIRWHVGASVAMAVLVAILLKHTYW